MPIEPKTTRLQAQQYFGLFAPHDIVSIIVIVALWAGLGVWWLTGERTLEQVILFAMANIVVMLVWVILLLYRILVWMLDLMADINLMPEAAARIVAAYYEGRRMPPPSATGAAVPK